jgi:formyltetrahydrofolate hydrolase
MSRAYILNLSCPDRIGIVAAVAGFLAERQGNILASAQFDDRSSNRFFMRVEFEIAAEPVALRTEFAATYDVPFHHLPVTRDTITAQEKKLLELLAEERIDCVVLARYMQVLSLEMCGRLSIPSCRASRARRPMRRRTPRA